MKQWILGASMLSLVGVGAQAATTQDWNRATPLSAQYKGAAPLNFDASFRAAARTMYSKGALAAGPFGLPSTLDARLGVPTFLWAGTDRAPAAVGPRKDAKAATEAQARAFLVRQRAQLGLDRRSIDDAVLTDLHDTGRGAVIARFQQKIGGVDVFMRQINVMTDRSGQLIATSGYFAPAALADGAPDRNGGSPERALSAAFADLGGMAKARDFVGAGSRGGYDLFKGGAVKGDLQISGQPRVKPVYFVKGDALVAARYVEISGVTRDGGTQRDFAYVIGADGEILFRKNLVEYEAFTYRMFADTDAEARPFDEPYGNGYAPFPGTTYDEFIDPVGADSALVTLESSSLIPTGDPWLPSRATETVGNNVDAYVDIDPYKGQFAGITGGPTDGLNPRLGDFRAATTSSRTFDYPLEAEVDPKTTEARNAAIVNLFFMNNWQHDNWYGSGFTESAGNAQDDNYGRGGADNDPIHAEGQDGSGSNNANMATPADGGSPRMQMYLFDGPFDGSLTVSAPASAAGEYLNITGAGFGPQAFSFSGEVVLVNDGSTGDGTGTVSDGCEAITNSVSGKIAMIDRGSCNFTVKVANAETAGAVGVIVVNNVSGSPIAMGGDDPGIEIGSIMVTIEDGATLKAGVGAPELASVERNEAPLLDGTIDNGIIAHEFFHYVSNRLIADGSGLSNSQGRGMGEGWSDFNSMLLEVRADDVLVSGNESYGKPYAIAFYAFPDLYFGLRRSPYSTDFAYNALTFKYIENGVPLPTTAPLSFGQDGASNFEVHNSGEIWANTLWECYAALLNSGRYTHDEARQAMQDYVIAGLKMTPATPTFLEARDAIIAAASASSEDDALALGAAFAKRGMGLYAIAPPRNSDDGSGVVEDFTPIE